MREGLGRLMLASGIGGTGFLGSFLEEKNGGEGRKDGIGILNRLALFPCSAEELRWKS